MSKIVAHADDIVRNEKNMFAYENDEVGCGKNVFARANDIGARENEFVVDEKNIVAPRNDKVGSERVSMERVMNTPCWEAGGWTALAAW